MSRFLLKLESFTLLQEGGPVFQPVDLLLREGEVVGLSGPNGAGKSTLLRSIAGIRRPTLKPSGNCIVLGVRREAGVLTLARAGVLLARQIPTSYNDLMVLDQVAISAMSPYSLLTTLFGWQRRIERQRVAEAVDLALNEFRLTSVMQNYVRELSTGQRRALALAACRVRLELGRVRLLLLDEPHSGLDTELQRRLHLMIQDAKRKECAVLLSEHLGEAHRPVADREIALTPGDGAFR